MSAIDSTVAVTSRIAYSRLSAGASSAGLADDRATDLAHDLRNGASSGLAT